MKHIKLQKFLVFLLAAVTLLSLPCSAARLPAVATAADTQEIPSYDITPYSTFHFFNEHVAHNLSMPHAVPCSPAAANERKLIPGGMPFGVKFTTDGVLVVGFCDVDTDTGKANPAYSAGLRTGDIIQKLDDHPVKDAAALSDTGF